MEAGGTRSEATDPRASRAAAAAQHMPIQGGEEGRDVSSDTTETV